MQKLLFRMLMVFILALSITGCGTKKVENKDTNLALSLDINSAVINLHGKYTGTVDDKDLPNGEGSFDGKLSNGKKFVYIGSFKNGHLDGKGKLDYPDGVMSQEGTFKNDKLNGDGKIIFKSGHTIEAKFVDGMRVYANPKLNFNVLVPGRFIEIPPMFPQLLMQAIDTDGKSNVSVNTEDVSDQKEGSKEYYDREFAKTSVFMQQLGARNVTTTMVTNSKGQPIMLGGYEFPMPQGTANIVQIMYLTHGKVCIVTYTALNENKNMYVNDIERTVKNLEYIKR